MSVMGLQAGRFYNSMLSIADSGLRDANLRMANSAHSIANLNTDGFVPDRVHSAAQPAGGVTSWIERSAAVPTDATFFSQTDLVTEGLNLILAKNAFKANAAVVRTASQMRKTLVDAVG